MSSSISTAHSAAESKVVTVKNRHGDLVIYDNNPAELPGCRHELDACLKRLGAFELLIKHRACRLSNATIAVQDVNSIPFVTEMVKDPDIESYSYKDPCPDTATRILRVNADRATRSEPAFTGYRDLAAVPQHILKLASPMPFEIAIEEHAYALTQLSIFKDRKKADDLLIECNRNGTALRAILDQEESKATGEDLTLVTGRRDNVEKAGMKGLPLTLATYENFKKEFNQAEVMCPPSSRRSDDQLRQLIGSLFIRDPARRKAWSDHINQPELFDVDPATGAPRRRSGPPRTYAEADTLAEQILRSSLVTEQIDEQGHAAPQALSAEQTLPASNPDRSQEESLLATDPRKSISELIERGPDGKPLYWIKGMTQCDCGTPDEGRHIRYKWPCAYYRNPNKDGQEDAQPAGAAQLTSPKGGRGFGKGGKGKKGKWGSKGKGGHFANVTEDQIAAIIQKIEAAKEDDTRSTASGSTSASRSTVSGQSASSNKQECGVAEYKGDDQLKDLLESTSLNADLASFFQGISDSSIVVSPPCASFSATLSSEVTNIFELSGASSPPLLSVLTSPLTSSLGLEGVSFHRASSSSFLSDYRDISETCAIFDPTRPSVWDVNLSRLHAPSVPTDTNTAYYDCGLVCSIALESFPVERIRVIASRQVSSIGAKFRFALHEPMQQIAFFAGVKTDKDAPPTIESGPDSLLFPMFRAPVDSGCTANCTNSIHRLVNVRPCNEEFKVADGKFSRCSAIGDMPVIAKDAEGKPYSFIIKDVRYVPGFKYTLLSVGQIWKDQKISAQFEDLNRLQFKGDDSRVVPFDSRFRLPTVTLVSQPLLAANLSPAKPKDGCTHATHDACIGFHNIKSTSHVARLPSAQASELLHRRSHLGHVKIRSLHHVTGDAPRVLTSASHPTCVHCAASQIRRAAHSGALSTPDPEPGKLHVDLKGPFPLSAVNKFRYAAFFIDEHSRYVFVKFLHDKSEIVEATKLVMAEFNALVGTPVDDQGRVTPRPTVRHLHRDHEGGLGSRQFEVFRAAETLYSTTSAPHDHDLNPIAESIINVISTLATTYKSQSGAPIGFWPEIIRYAVDWHNSSPQASVGSSTSDPQITPTQRFQLKQPKIMDLATFGCRCVVLKPPVHQSKTTLSSRGWVGMFLGRSADSVGTYEVWVPSINRKVRSSSLVVDEEYFPWLGAKAHQPLVSAVTASRFVADHIGSSPPPVHESSGISGTSKSGNMNSAPSPNLTFLNLFSGAHHQHRKGGLSNTMKAFGWNNIIDVDNHPTLGGGWQDDILNDSKYVEILRSAKAGAFDAILAGVPCSTFSVARCFDASSGGGDHGPAALRNAEYPDGLPHNQISPKLRKELLTATRILDRTVEILIAAYHSPRKTTIVLENPADRSIPGTPQHMADVSHGSLFATKQFRKLQDSIPLSSMATFANCRFDADSQKYITLWYTNDAAPVLDSLNESKYQCNHPPGTHKSIAGGRDAYGYWKSQDTASYMPGLCVKAAMAFTYARTGDPTPLALRTASPSTSSGDSSGEAPSERAQPLHEVAVPDVELPISSLPRPPANAAPQASPSEPRSGTPRRLHFPISGASVPPSGLSFSPTPASSSPDSPDVDVGGGISASPRQYPINDASNRAVRGSTRAGTADSIQLQLARARELAARREARNYPTRSPLAPISESPADHSPDRSPPYSSFTGTPIREGVSFQDDSAAEMMEATVADLVAECAFDESFDVRSSRTGVTGWFHFDGELPKGATPEAEGSYVAEATTSNIISLINNGGISKHTQHTLMSLVAHSAFRADSEGAPETYAEAVKRGEPWPSAISKEFGNHGSNGSWELVPQSSVPRGRRIHKFVWVFKQKRDGTAKARLCVQGCTLEEGVDYDQTFAKPLQHSSARGLFAYAARNRCKVRSIDFVAAYLQGEFIDGEVVYCRQPPGSNEIGPDGLPMVCKIVKPIYGIPQAGRRLQRKIFPWCRELGLRQLDDSDDCVFVWDDPDGKEIFAVGIYVDNLQVVHSVEVDENGEPIDKDSFYAKFLRKLNEDWDVVDEGPMQDLLGIDCNYLPDGSIVLHQGKFLRKALGRFAPDGPKHKRASVPFSADLPRLVIEAYDASPNANEPKYPELVKPYQRMVGTLMYACTGTRPDLAYAVHQHCRVLSRPTPELMAELDHVWSYLYEYPDIGIRFTPEDGVLRGTADASWEVRASTSGWIIYWHGAPLTWGSRKQKSTALSSMESEIIALSEAAKDVIFLRKYTRGLVPELGSDPTILSTDNKAARDLSYNPEHHDRSKHVERRHFFIRDMVEAQEIVVPLVPTHDNDADFFTKPLPPKRFKFLRRKVMNLRNE